MVSHSLQSSIDSARTFQNDLLKLFKSRSYSSLQLVEALAYAPKPTSVVELSQEAPFQRSYSTINKGLNEFASASLIFKEIREEGAIKTVEIVDSYLFSKITKPFSIMFFKMLPQEINRKFRLFALDVTSIARIHARTLDDRSYVYQANQVGIPITVGLQASVLTYLPEHSSQEANWQLPVSLQRVSTDTTACKVASTQLKLISEITDSPLTVIVADIAYGTLAPYSEEQVVIARGRIDRKGRRPVKGNQIFQRGRPRKYEPEIIRFMQDYPSGTKAGSDEKYEYADMMNKQLVNVRLNRWNDVYVEGHTELVDVVKAEVFTENEEAKTLCRPLLLIVSGKQRREITALDAYQSYQRRFDIEHFFRFVKQKLLFCAYQTPHLDHQMSWWWFCLMAYWLLYHVRHLAQGITRPWHKTKELDAPAGPGKVKRLFAIRIFPILGSPSPPPISGVKSLGRQLGTRLTKRK